MLVRFWNHSRIFCWNSQVQSNGGKVSWSTKR